MFIHQIDTVNLMSIFFFEKQFILIFFFKIVLNWIDNQINYSKYSYYLSPYTHESCPKPVLAQILLFLMDKLSKKSMTLLVWIKEGCWINSFLFSCNIQYSPKGTLLAWHAYPQYLTINKSLAYADDAIRQEISCFTFPI